MEFFELTIKIPVLRRRWLRFSVKSLLLLTLVVAVSSGAWYTHRRGQHARLVQQIESMKIAQDKTLRKWKVASGNFRNGGINERLEEAALRAQYFEHRDAIRIALQQLARYDGPAEK